MRSFFRNKRPNAFDYQPRYPSSRNKKTGERGLEEGFLRSHRASSPTGNSRYRAGLDSSKRKGYQKLVTGAIVIGLIVVYFTQGAWIQAQWGHNGQFMVLGLIFIAAIRFLRKSNT